MTEIEKYEKSKQRMVVVIILMIVSVFTSCLGYILYLRNTSKDLSDKLATAIAEKGVVESELESVVAEKNLVEDELDKYKSELDIAREEIQQQLEEIEQYKQMIEDEEAKWQRRYEEYPIATEAWIAMKNLGWSDVTCAGIMGNLMAETGGSGSLNLDWDSNGSNGYGLVQWIGSRRSAIKSKYGTYPSVKEQVQFIHDELYGTNGVSCQVSESQLEAIMNAETPEECAYAFACYYERCAAGVRSMRRGYAREAYEYFAA